jgi:hypothetical protein
MPDLRPLDARYLYVLKDSTGVYYVTGEPTLGDIERVKDGGLEIIRLSDFRHLGVDGAWHPLTAGGLTTVYGILGPPANLPLESIRASAATIRAKPF